MARQHRKPGETATEENLRKMREAQERGGPVCGPEKGWIRRNFDGSFYMRTGWYSAHAWMPRDTSGGTPGKGWRARVDVMIAQYDVDRTVLAETYVIQAEGGFGRTHEFATSDEAKAFCDRQVVR